MTFFVYHLNRQESDLVTLNKLKSWALSVNYAWIYESFFFSHVEPFEMSDQSNIWKVAGKLMFALKLDRKNVGLCIEAR